MRFVCSQSVRRAVAAALGVSVSACLALLSSAPALAVQATAPMTMHPMVRSHGSITGVVNSSVVGSLNWAGYAEASSNPTYHSVTASWVVPPLTGKPGEVSEWVGLGGFNSSSLIQTGVTEASGRSGQTEAYAFWEVLPAAAQFNFSAPVPVGKSVTASVTPVVGHLNSYELKVMSGGAVLIDKTVEVKAAYAAAAQKSAEWITEDPYTLSRSGTLSQVPLANFKAIVYGGSAANGAALSSHATAIVMVDSHDKPLVEPTKVTGSGAFADVYVGPGSGPVNALHGHGGK